MITGRLGLNECLWKLRFENIRKSTIHFPEQMKYAYHNSIINVSHFFLLSRCNFGNFCKIVQMLLNFWEGLRVRVISFCVTNYRVMCFRKHMIFSFLLCCSFCINLCCFNVAEEIMAAFRRLGPLVVDWPHKAESKSYFPPKGW